MTGDDMLRVNFETTWDPAVTAVARNTTLVTVDGPASGFDFLRNKWPGARGVAFAKARRAAMGAMSGTVSAGDARRAFILACEDAGCLVRSE
jgi:Protein of unknown function (DUF982)